MVDNFLSEIEAEHHQHLLEAGNLNKPRKSSLWTGENNWESQGYVLRCQHLRCQHCQETTPLLLGAFHRESNGRGDSRETALDLRTLNIPQDTPRVFESVPIPRCGFCL